MQATPIAILSLNPAVDMTYEIPCLLADQKVHALDTRIDPGGNGINVGRALRRLGVTARNYCVVAGEIGQLLQHLLVGQLDEVVYTEVAGETRINVTAIEQTPSLQYEISGLGPHIPPAQLNSLLQHFVKHSAAGYGVLTGTLQNGLHVSQYADLARRIGELGGRAVVDTHGVALQSAIEAQPFLIKPNRYELETLLERHLDSIEEVAAEARALQRRGVMYVCVSLGAEGAILCGPENCYHAVSPAVDVRSSVGAGDSMVAALVAAFARGESIQEALALSVACATATVTRPGTELFESGQVQAFLPHIEVRWLDI
jgi:6-phosphofructokinase 2